MTPLWWQYLVAKYELMNPRDILQTVRIDTFYFLLLRFLNFYFYILACIVNSFFGFRLSNASFPSHALHISSFQKWGKCNTKRRYKIIACFLFNFFIGQKTLWTIGVMISLVYVSVWLFNFNINHNYHQKY